MNNISIIGSGGHTRSSINLIREEFNTYNFSIYDDSFIPKTNEHVCKIKLVGKIDAIAPEDFVFLSIGNNIKRHFYFNKFYNKIIKKNLFHRSSFLEREVEFGISNQIFANVYINSYVKIGDNNIINTSVVLEHEVKIGNHNHISVGSKICGRVKIGNNCMIGAGVIIIDNISICDDVVIGAGSVVVKDIVESGIYVGVPARKIK